MEISRRKNTIDNVVKTLALPVIVYIAFQLICLATGTQGFGVGNDLKTIIYTTVYSGFLSLAMSFNLMQGRIDFSIGSTMILTGIVGGRLAQALDAGPVVTLLCLIVVGAVIGCFSGLVFNFLKLPAMITGMGLAMIYEGLTMALFDGAGLTLSIKQTNTLFSFGRQPYSVILLLVVLIVLVFLYKFTKFGYNSWALTGNRKITVDRGINERINAVMCYVMAGACLGIAIGIFCSKYGYVSAEIGLTSSSYMITGFLPFGIGELLAKYSDMNVAVIIGALCQAMLSSFMVKVGLSTSMQTVINGVVICALLIYTSNAGARIESRLIKEKLARLGVPRKQSKAA